MSFTASAIVRTRVPFTVSGNYAVALPNGTAVTDARGTTWRITGGNQVSVNGVVDAVTSGVAKVIYVGGKIWQIAPSGWYSKTLPTDPWTFSSPGLSSADMATVNVGETGGLVDARNFVWTLSAGGVISADGTPDAVTHHVTALVYFGGKIWQTTPSGWYFKTLPTDAWISSASAPGISKPPGPSPSGNRRTALGAQLGDPGSINNGPATWFSQFRAAMNEGPTIFTTYATPDSNADWTQTQPWKDSANWSAYGIKNLNALPGAAPIAIPLIGLPLAKFQNGNERDFADIQAGRWDAQFAAVYDTYVGYGFTTLYSRPGFEMNGDWFAWSKPYGQANAAFNANFAATFAHCAKHAYSYAASHPGVTIQTVWNPGYMYDAANGVRPDVSQLYPGDQYVDHIGIDTYGPYAEGGGAPSNGPSQVDNDNRYFSLDDAIKFCIAHGKPLCFPETGCSPGETAFQTNMKNRLTASPNCKVSFISIWNQPTGNGSNSVWSSNSNSGAAWRAMLQAVRNTNGPW